MSDQEIYDKIINFKTNIMHDTAMFSNIYYTRKYDRDGNLIDEFYGINHMTHYGMTKYCVPKSDGTYDNLPTKLYIGYGSQADFDPSSQELISRIMDESVSVVSSTPDYNYPLYFFRGDTPETSYVTCVCRYEQLLLNYNVPGRTVSIGEWGLGDNYNQLWTHSKIFDKYGTKTYLTKTGDQKITIDVFFCMVYPVSVILNERNNGIYHVITQMNNFVEKHMYEQSAFTYKRNNITTNRSRVHATGYGVSSVEGISLPQDTCIRITTLPDFQLYNQADDSQGYICGFCKYAPGWVTIEPIDATSWENFECVVSPTTITAINASSLSDQFGTTVDAPFTRVDVSNVYTFDVVAGTFTNPTSFNNNPSLNYCETSLSSKCTAPINFTNAAGQNVTMYVHVNTDPNNPILGFDSTGIETLYTTNEYWGDWILITDVTNIPQEYRNNYYWITKYNVDLKPTRSSKFALRPSCGDEVQLGFSSMSTYLTEPFDGSDVGSPKPYFVHNNIVYYPEENTSYAIPNISKSSHDQHFGYGRWLITFTRTNDTNQYHFTDVVVHSSKNVTSTFTNLTTSFGTSAYITSTGNGFLCIQTYNSTLSKRESMYINMRGISSFNDDITLGEHLIGNGSAVTVSCAIWDTTLVAYRINGENKIRILDMSSSATREYDIPSNIDVKFMWGHRNFLWITDCSSNTYVIHLTKTNSDPDYAEICAHNSALFQSSLPSYWQFVRTSHVDQYMIIYRSDQDTTYMNEVWYIDMSDPYTMRKLDAFGGNSGNNDVPKHVELRYINATYDGNRNCTRGTLALIATSQYVSNDYTGARNMVIDFGRYVKSSVTSYVSQASTTIYPIIPYGEFVVYATRKIPIEYMLTHKIVGTTNTVTALNSIKNISKQSWETYFTNILGPQFDTIPVGDHR